MPKTATNYEEELGGVLLAVSSGEAPEREVAKLRSLVRDDASARQYVVSMSQLLASLEVLFEKNEDEVESVLPAAE